MLPDSGLPTEHPRAHFSTFPSLLVGGYKIQVWGMLTSCLSVSLAIISLWSMRDSSSTSSSAWADSRPSSDFGDLRGRMVSAEGIRHTPGFLVHGGLEVEATLVMVNINCQLSETERRGRKTHAPWAAPSLGWGSDCLTGKGELSTGSHCSWLLDWTQ